MSLLDTRILKQCLFDSTLKEIQEIEALDYSFVVSDESFKERIKESINTNSPASKSRPKRVLVALVAAVIICFSIMFSVSGQIRNAIINFFVEVYDTFYSLLIQNEESVYTPSTIETIYKPSYLSSNGYIEIYTTSTELNQFTIWSKDNVIVDLSQHTIDENDITLDSENVSYQTAYVGSYTVYYSLKNNIYYLKWISHGYSFSLSCDDTLSWNEMEQIILSLEPTN
ncbi:MAG: hypothetical protein IJW54_00140 [Clostridia bacterium]|nr:hypothetical protein [Clostridia bacterium]